MHTFDSIYSDYSFPASDFDIHMLSEESNARARYLSERCSRTGKSRLNVLAEHADKDLLDSLVDFGNIAYCGDDGVTVAHTLARRGLLDDKFSSRRGIAEMVDASMRTVMHELAFAGILPAKYADTSYLLRTDLERRTLFHELARSGSLFGKAFEKFEKCLTSKTLLTEDEKGNTVLAEHLLARPQGVGVEESLERALDALKLPFLSLLFTKNSHRRSAAEVALETYGIDIEKFVEKRKEREESRAAKSVSCGFNR